jgi:hypothetical protein
MSTRIKDAGKFFGTSAPDDGLVEAEIAAFDRFWQCPFLGTGLSCIQASDIGAPSAENVDFVVIQTHLPLLFLIGRKTIKRFTSIRPPPDPVPA